MQESADGEAPAAPAGSRKNEVARYYCNKNPRSPELLGIADKPRGYATWNRRVDYYHRYYNQVSPDYIMGGLLRVAVATVVKR